MRKIEAYQCECGKVFAKKSNCLKHEKNCWRNCENKTCKTCPYFDNDKKACFHPTPGQREIAFQKEELTFYKNCESWDCEVDPNLFKQ